MRSSLFGVCRISAGVREESDGERKEVMREVAWIKSCSALIAGVSGTTDRLNVRCFRILYLPIKREFHVASVNIARLSAHVELFRGGENNAFQILGGEVALGLEPANHLLGHGYS